MLPTCTSRAPTHMLGTCTCFAGPSIIREQVLCVSAREQVEGRLVFSTAADAIDALALAHLSCAFPTGRGEHDRHT